jgi:GT2 family glycosyltransferase
MRIPSVTIIIPTFNWSSVLPFSIGSALRQMFADFELLVVGDGCTDDSAAVVAAVGDARVRWMNLAANVGHQTGPNNEGLRRARGRFIAYLGHDDLWFPHHLECLVRALESGADLAYGMTAMVRPDGRSPEATPIPTRYRPGMWIPPTSVMHRREVVEQVGGWRHPRDVPTDPEVDLWRRVHAAGHAIESVRRLTAIKFPAAWRRDVYRDRPHHEQAAWFGRVAAEPDLEATLLGQMLSDTGNRAASAAALVRSLGGVVARALRSQLLRRAPGLYLLAKDGQRRRSTNSTRETRDQPFS